MPVKRPLHGSLGQQPLPHFTTIADRSFRARYPRFATAGRHKPAPTAKAGDGPLTRMKQKIDAVLGRAIYSRRIGVVEPVFGHLRENPGLNHSALRGRTKVDSQWKLMTVLHNLIKIHRNGMVMETGYCRVPALRWTRRVKTNKPRRTYHWVLRGFIF